MADQSQEQTNSEQTKRKRAYGTFPRLPLSKALELPQKIYGLGEGEDVRRLYVFDKLGKSSTSGHSKDWMAAANGGYGLITGSYATEYLGLTERGRKIVAAKDELTKYEAIYEVLFSITAQC